MKRRGFLQSMLGLAATPALPLAARAAAPAAIEAAPALIAVGTILAFAEPTWETAPQASFYGLNDPGHTHSIQHAHMAGVRTVFKRFDGKEWQPVEVRGGEIMGVTK